MHGVKIVIDKIEAHPPHAFSPREVRAFLRLLPPQLLHDVGLVRLSSAMEHSAAQGVASFSRLERRLVIVSRKVSRDAAMLAVLRCLIRANLGRPTALGRTADLQPDAVDNMAKELHARVAPLMPTAPQWSRVLLKYVSPPRETNE